MFDFTLSRFPRSWDPWRDLERLQDEINQAFGTRDSLDSGFQRLNVWSNDEGAQVVAALPGVDSKSIDISVLGKTLTLKGTRPLEDLKPGEAYHRRERRGGEFLRSLELPFRVDANRVDAHYHNGVLQVTLPRAAEERATKIKVAAA